MLTAYVSMAYGLQLTGLTYIRAGKPLAGVLGSVHAFLSWVHSSAAGLW